MNIENILLSSAQRLEKFFPQMERELKNARMEQSPSEYLSTCITRALKLSVPSSVSLIAAGLITDVSTTTKIGIASFPILAIMGFLTFAKLPKIRTNRRTRKLEKDLPYALRDVLIELESGIPLYNAMKTVTSGYGEASEEFKVIVREVDGGKSMIDAIEESIVRNPSEQYRRAMWQLNNSLKSGTDIATSLESIVDSILKDQKLKIKKYGQELNPYILVYLLIAVVGPSLGITGLIVISSFTGTSVGTTLYMGVLFGLIVTQLIFLNLVKSKRPEVKA
jgi:flagellar protein FlaJ